jgi:hypothetical protein
MSRRMALRTSGRSRVNTTPHANNSCESHQGCAERLDRANDSGVTLPAWPMAGGPQPAVARRPRFPVTLETRVAELERRLGKDSSNSSKPPSSDGLRKPARTRQRGAEQAGGRRTPGKQPGAPGAHLAQVAQPDQVIRHVPDRCQGCGAELAGAVVVGVEARQVFELPPLRLLAREHRAERRRCACGPRPRLPPPPRLVPRPAMGRGVRALCCYLLVHQHLPVDRAAQLLGDVLGAPLGVWRPSLGGGDPAPPGARAWPVGPVRRGRRLSRPEPGPGPRRRRPPRRGVCPAELGRGPPQAGTLPGCGRLLRAESRARARHRRPRRRGVRPLHPRRRPPPAGTP